MADKRKQVHVGKLATRKRKLRFVTEAVVFERGKQRNVVVEANPYVATLRLKGYTNKRAVSLGWDTIFYTALQRATTATAAAKRQARKEAAAAKKGGGR